MLVVDFSSLLGDLGPCSLSIGHVGSCKMIEVDGSFGEGGGQILRTAVSLAGVLGKDMRVYNIRAGRSQPGLKAQHLTGVRAAAELCDATLKGGEVGSTELSFQPSRLKAGRFRFDVGTAGSITLVLQVLMPLMAYAPGAVEATITGGTDVKWSPPIDYLSQVTVPILRKMGYEVHLDVKRRGHYPKGGGMVRVSVTQVEHFKPIMGLEQGRVVAIRGISHARGLPRHVAERQARAATEILGTRSLPRPEISVDLEEVGPGLSVGSGLFLLAETEKGAILGADSLGERGKPAEAVGSEAARKLIEEIEAGGFLDRHMGDIMVPYMALADGTSEVTTSQVTQHTLTNVKVAELVLGGGFEVDGVLGNRGRLRATGIGLRNSSFVSPRVSTVSPRL